MITIGNTKTFAIESRITRAYQQRELLALGSFIIYIEGKSYGVNQPEASLLACSFDEVGRRIEKRGEHTASFSCAQGGEVAQAVFDAIYGASLTERSFWGLSKSDIAKEIRTNRLIWAPDGDQAFDDGSYVLQFDIQDQVRLIGFRTNIDSRYIPATLGDIRLPADLFYEGLRQWKSDFEAAWAQAEHIEP